MGSKAQTLSPHFGFSVAEGKVAQKASPTCCSMNFQSMNKTLHFQAQGTLHSILDILLSITWLELQNSFLTKGKPFCLIHWSGVKVFQSCPTLCDPMDYTVHGILQARILGCVAFPFSRGSSLDLLYKTLGLESVCELIILVLFYVWLLCNLGRQDFFTLSLNLYKNEQYYNSEYIN